MSDINYVEEDVECIECGKLMKIVVLEGTDTSDYLCPKCSSGEFSIELEE